MGNHKYGATSGPGKTAVFAIRFITMLLIAGILIIQIVDISRGGNNIMTRAEAVLRDYPNDQFERSIHEAFSTVENMHQISSRAKFLMEQVKPEEVQRLAERATAVSDDDIRNTMNVLRNLNRLLQTVNADDLGKMVTNMRTISEHMNATRLNQLIDSTNAIESRLKGLNEIKVKF